MSSKCTPPLQFVPNGAAGSLPITPPDPTPPLMDTNPGFGDLASSLLGDAGSDADGFDAVVADASAGADAIDAAGTAMDATLDTILLLLDATQQTGTIDSAVDDFAGDQPQAQSLLDGVNGVTAPDLGMVPMVLPSGAAVVTFGGPPEAGGVVHAGDAAYTRHLQLLAVTPGIHNVDADGGSGPNPPFTSWGPVVQEADATGKLWWVYLIGIDPQAAGTFTGTAQYQVNVTITGISGTMTRSLVFQVVIEP